MTSALLKSINTKNQLYKEWIKTDVNDLNLFSRRKDEFKSYYTLFDAVQKKLKDCTILAHLQYIRMI